MLLSENEGNKRGPSRWKKQQKKFKERSNKHGTDMKRAIMGNVL
jgi:hypothetical protein